MDSLQAGRLPELDSLASQFFSATGAARDAIYKDASQLAENLGPAATHYVRVMEKVVNGSEEYVEKEAKRYVFPILSLESTLTVNANRLASILKKRTLAPAKLDELKIKSNILSAFKRAEETLGRVTAEL